MSALSGIDIALWDMKGMAYSGPGDSSWVNIDHLTCLENEDVG